MKTHQITSHDMTWHLATNHITSPHVTSQPTALLHRSLQPTTSKQVTTSPPSNGWRLVHSNNSVWASQWLVTLCTFYRQILSLTYSFFSLKLPPPACPALLVFIILEVLVISFFRIGVETQSALATSPSENAHCLHSFFFLEAAWLNESALLPLQRLFFFAQCCSGKVPGGAPFSQLKGANFLSTLMHIRSCGPEFYQIASYQSVKFAAHQISASQLREKAFEHVERKLATN